MNRPTDSSYFECSKELIADYHDGELNPAESENVEKHMAGCPSCSSYLNSLKLVSTSLEIMLDRDPIRIPPEFSRRVTTAAESNTSELRSKKERSRALFVFAGLLGLIAVAIGVGGSGLSSAASVVVDRVIAVGSFVSGLLYSLAIGFSVIFGSVCTKMVFGSTLAVAVIIAVLFVSFLIFSKHIRRFNRF